MASESGWHLTFHLPQPETKGRDLLENAIVQLSGDPRSRSPFRVR